MSDQNSYSNFLLSPFKGRSTGLPSAASAPGSIRSFRPDLSLSRRPSIEDVPENEPGPSTPRNFSRGSASQPTSRPGSRPTSRPPSPPSTMTARAGSRSRFSLSSVSSVLMDAVRSSSPKAAHFADSREQPDDNERTRRGRTQQKGKAAQSPRTSMVRAKSKERSTLSKIGDILKLDHEDAQAGDGWKEFKKGKHFFSFISCLLSFLYLQALTHTQYLSRYPPIPLPVFGATTALSCGAFELQPIVRAPSSPSWQLLARSS